MYKSNHTKQLTKHTFLARVEIFIFLVKILLREFTQFLTPLVQIILLKTATVRQSLQIVPELGYL